MMVAPKDVEDKIARLAQIRATVDAAVYDRDPACSRYLEPLLYFKGFHALSTHRFAHELWSAGRRDFVRAGWLARQLEIDGVAHLHTHFISMPADIAALAARLSARPFSISASDELLRAEIRTLLRDAATPPKPRRPTKPSLRCMMA